MRIYITATTTDVVVFNGITFRRYPMSKRLQLRNYYYPHAGHIKKGVGALHREVWKHNRGPIPEGMHVHHKDRNTLNNSIENLEVVDFATHRRLHAEAGSYHTAACIAHRARVFDKMRAGVTKLQASKAWKKKQSKRSKAWWKAHRDLT